MLWPSKQASESNLKQRRRICKSKSERKRERAFIVIKPSSAFVCSEFQCMLLKFIYPSSFAVVFAGRLRAARHIHLLLRVLLTFGLRICRVTTSTIVITVGRSLTTGLIVIIPVAVVVEVNIAVAVVVLLILLSLTLILLRLMRLLLILLILMLPFATLRHQLRLGCILALSRGLVPCAGPTAAPSLVIAIAPSLISLISLISVSSAASVANCAGVRIDSLPIHLVLHFPLLFTLSVISTLFSSFFSAFFTITFCFLKLSLGHLLMLLCVIWVLLLIVLVVVACSTERLLVCALMIVATIHVVVVLVPATCPPKGVHTSF